MYQETLARTHRRAYNARMDKLREWFKLTGVSQAELADEIDVTRATIQNWLTGKTYPNGLHLRRLHERTGIPVEDLIPKDNAA